MDAGFTPLVATHAVAATLAMVLGAVNVLRRRRGDAPHRFIGRVWLVAMYFTAFSSFWIQDLRPGSYSWIHGLSAFTIVTLSLGLWNVAPWPDPCPRGQHDRHLRRACSARSSAWSPSRIAWCPARSSRTGSG